MINFRLYLYKIACEYFNKNSMFLICFSKHGIFSVSVTTPLYHTGYAFKLTNKGVVPLPIDKSLLKTPVLNMVSTHHILPSLVNYNTLKTPVAQEGREVTIAENPEVCQNGTCWVNVAQPYAVQPIELPDLRVPPPVLLPPQESWQNIHNQAQSGIFALSTYSFMNNFA